MVETIGKKLQQARINKGLSLDEAARLTKIRPDRITDLENDEYSNFPNLAYAKGFLVIYSKLVGVDVSGFTETLTEGTSHVGVDEYEYLTNTPGARPTIIRHKPKRSLLPWVVMAAVGCVLLFAWYLSNAVSRLGDLEELSEKRNPARTEAVETNVPTTPPPSAVPEEGQPPEIAAAPEGETATVATSEAESPEQNEVSLFAFKKTWVKVQRDDPGSAPVYEDWLFPSGKPLLFTGNRFIIQTADKDAIEIRRNGEVVPYQSPGITIE